MFRRRNFFFLFFFSFFFFRVTCRNTGVRYIYPLITSIHHFVYIYIYMDKKYYCTFSISSKAAVYSRRLIHIITERIYGDFFVQLMVSCIFSSLFTLHVFLSKSVFPLSFFFLYISSPRNLFFLFSLQRSIEFQSYPDDERLFF